MPGAGAMPGWVPGALEDIRISEGFPEMEALRVFEGMFGALVPRGSGTGIGDAMKRANRGAVVVMRGGKMRAAVRDHLGDSYGSIIYLSCILRVFAQVDVLV